MKKIALALILASGLAHAEQWLEGLNQGGGKIILLQNKCTDKPDELGRVVMATISTGPTIWGCWYFFSDMVHVVWQDKTTYSYPKTLFQARSDEK